MIDYSDCIILLSQLKQEGLDTSEYVKKLVVTKTVDLDTLKFINDNRQLDVTNFYNKIRKSYNNKKSKVYIQIMKEIEDPNDVLITLSALLTQILLFSNTVSDKQMFLKHSRCDEISKVLNIYFQTYDSTLAIKLLRLIKIDIKALESLK